MLATFYCDGFIAALPLQVLPDSPATFEPKEAAEVATTVIVESPNKKKVKKKPAAFDHLVAMAHSLFSMSPHVNFGVYQTTFEGEKPDGSILVLDEESQQYFYGGDEEQPSKWCLPAELRLPGGSSRMLVLACDEGSPGFKVWCFLASVAALRTVFYRDPPHRFTGAFVNTLRGVPRVFELSTDVLLIHKWRRAPFGSGRFFKEVRECLAVLHSTVGEGHPLLEAHLPAIARDMQVSNDELASPGAMMAAIEAMLSKGVGAKAWMCLEKRWPHPPHPHPLPPATPLTHPHQPPLTPEAATPLTPAPSYAL